ncbi:MAG TPA: SDR family oxidoreductase [Alphaproteobacteria bacterium]|nr:SDR family oxidoreductase [Alphaproteobacteria bacterium]
MALHNPLLDKLRAGDTVGCLWLLLGSPAVAELMAEPGPNAIVFDLQHGLWDRQSLENAIGLVAPRSTAVVRVADNSPHAISTALDAGALGILVPLVDTPEQAAAAVAAAKYPPAGLRSAGGVRPLKDFIAYGKEANDAVMVGVMIETKKGVENAAKIARVPGVDLVFIGTGDLAMSLGTFPEFDDRHEAAIEKVQAACRAAGTPCGAFTPFVTFALDRRRQGYQWVVLGSDIDIVHGAAKMTTSRFATKPPAGKDGKPLKSPLKGAVALVTGTSRGIGPEIVKALLEAGAARVYCAARNPETTRELVATAPRKLIPLALDVTDAAQVREAARRCTDVTLLINNAGVNFNTPLLGIGGTDNARAEIETNYFGTLGMCRAFAPILKRNGGGAIVNMLSILANMNLPLMGSLCASKAAELSMSQALRAELAGQGTRVMTVQPGAVDTDMTRDFEGPKMKAPEVAAAVIHGLATGQDDVYPGKMASWAAMGLATDAKALERQFATYLPPKKAAKKKRR